VRPRDVCRGPFATILRLTAERHVAASRCKHNYFGAPSADYCVNWGALGTRTGANPRVRRPVLADFEPLAESHCPRGSELHGSDWILAPTHPRHPGEPRVQHCNMLYNHSSWRTTFSPPFWTRCGLATSMCAHLRCRSASIRDHQPNRHAARSCPSGERRTRNACAEIDDQARRSPIRSEITRRS